MNSKFSLKNGPIGFKNPLTMLSWNINIHFKRQNLQQTVAAVVDAAVSPSLPPQMPLPSAFFEAPLELDAWGMTAQS